MESIMEASASVSVQNEASIAEEAQHESARSAPSFLRSEIVTYPGMERASTMEPMCEKKYFAEQDFTHLRKEKVAPAPPQVQIPVEAADQVIPAWTKHRTLNKIERFDRLHRWDHTNAKIKVYIFWAILVVSLGSVATAYQVMLHQPLPVKPTAHQAK